MSRIFVESFFPVATSLLKSRSSTVVANLYSTLFPDDVVERCPEVVVVIGRFGTIRNPILLVWAVVGSYIGLVRGVVLLLAPLWKQQEQQQQPNTNILWSLAFLCFGWMNVVAIPLHCLVPVPVDVSPVSLPQQYPLLWLLDAYFTGAFSMAIVAACRREYYVEQQQRVSICRTPSTNSSEFVWIREWLVWNVVGGGGSIVSFIFWQQTLPLELWYALPVLLSTAVLFPLLIQEVVGDKKHSSWKPVFVFVTAVVMFVGGLSLDAPLCRWTTDRHAAAAGMLLLDSWMVGTVAFCACDLVFYGLSLRLRSGVEVVEYSTNKKKQ
jgi:hypothetical protein